MSLNLISHGFPDLPKKILEKVVRCRPIGGTKTFRWGVFINPGLALNMKPNQPMDIIAMTYSTYLPFFAENHEWLQPTPLHCCRLVQYYVHKLLRCFVHTLLRHYVPRCLTGVIATGYCSVMSLDYRTVVSIVISVLWPSHRLLQCHVYRSIDYCAILAIDD